MTSDALDIARLRMQNSGLGGSFAGAVDVVSSHVAMQSQDYGPATWSIAQRAPGVTSDDIEQAIADGSIIRTHVLRPTWHFVAREDARWLLALTGPRVQQSMARRRRELGLDTETRARARAAIVDALEGGTALTRDEIAKLLESRGIDPAGQRLPHLLMDCELEAVICSGGRAGRHQTYALANERLPGRRPFDRDEAVVHLVRRYLDSHAPATVHDLSWWSSLTIGDIRRALDHLSPDVENRTVDGLELWSMTSTAEPADSSGKGGHLLQTYDELIVGYTRSRFFGDPRAEQARAGWKNRTLPTGLVLLDARIGGHWRRTTTKTAVKVEVLLYDEPTRSHRTALEEAASKLADFVGLRLELQIGLL